jgi:hypothetical protein
MLLACIVHVLGIHDPANFNSLQSNTFVGKDAILFQEIWVGLYTIGVTIAVLLVVPSMTMAVIEHGAPMACYINECKPHFVYKVFGMFCDVVRM